MVILLILIIIITYIFFRDKFSYEEAVNYIAEYRSKGMDAQEIAQSIVEESLNRGSLDNITVAIIFLQESKLDSGNVCNRQRSASDSAYQNNHEVIEEEEDENEKKINLFEFLRVSDQEMKKIQLSLKISDDFNLSNEKILESII